MRVNRKCGVMANTLTPEMMEHINRRRRQMHLHSLAYYMHDVTFISDATFDKWALELRDLQRKYPECLDKGYLPRVFINWTGDTGMHLPWCPRMFSLYLSFKNRKEWFDGEQTDRHATPA